MRVWLDPDKLAARNLTAGDVVKVAARAERAGGRRADRPAAGARGPGVSVHHEHARAGWSSPSSSPTSSSRPAPKGEVTRLQRRQPGSSWAPSNQDIRCRLDGKPSVGPGHLSVARLERAGHGRRGQGKMDGTGAPLSARGCEYAIVYDTTPFISESVDEVFKTLRDAIILVAIVVLLFLQDWKALILPMIDVPVSLIGTFAVMALMGFTLNNLTLFGLVLAIGIVVDDAIVVLENIERWMAKGLPVREATIKAMDEITGPIIAITLVLSSVFLPSAFIPGITGQFYRQFALTIAASMLISAINAMTMTPARAVAIFKNRKVRPAGHLEGQEALPWWGVALGAVRLAVGHVAVALVVPLLAARQAVGNRAGRSLGAVYGAGDLPAGRRRRLAWFWRPGQCGAGPCSSTASTGSSIAFTQLYGVAWAGALRLQRDRAAGLRRAAGPDLLRADARADRLHPDAGQGLPGGQHPAARLGLAGAHDRGGSTQVEKIAQEMPGVGPHAVRFRASRSC